MAKGGSGLAAPVWNARRSPLNSGGPWPEPKVAAARVLGIQRKLHKWASDDQQRRFSDLHNLVCDPVTLMVAWRRVRGNRGSRSAGIDGQTAYEIEVRQGVERFLGELREELRSGTFRPLAVKERAIPKRGGKLRYLGIPTVRDRVVQAALKLVLEPIFEADFQPCSYGFRPGRRTQDAIAEVQHFTFRSYEWVVEGDIEACFDRIDHAALMGRVRDRIEDKRVLRLIKAFLHAGILKQHGGLERSVTGTPQGGILSPLLANIALSALDEHFARAWEAMGNVGQRYRARKRGEATYRLVRYADDFVICVAGTRRHAEALVTETARVLRPLGLTLSMEKTRITHIDEGFDFLGWRVKRDLGRRGRPGIFLFASKAALATVKAKDQADHPQRHQSVARSAPAPAQPGAARLVRLFPLRSIVADLSIPAPIHVATGHGMAATQVPEAQLALAATPPPSRLVADRQGNDALQPGGGQHDSLPLPSRAHRHPLAVRSDRLARCDRLPRATAIPVQRQPPACPWRAGCGGTRTSGSEGGGEQTTARERGIGGSPPTLRRVDRRRARRAPAR